LIVGGALFVIGIIIAAVWAGQFAGMLYKKTSCQLILNRVCQLGRINDLGNRCLKINNCNHKYQNLKKKKRMK
jgi:hypothetical protein